MQWCRLQIIGWWNSNRLVYRLYKTEKKTMPNNVLWDSTDSTGTYLSYSHVLDILGRRDRMVVGLTIINAISAYHHKSCEFESSSWRGVLDTTLFDKVCQ